MELRKRPVLTRGLVIGSAVLFGPACLQSTEKGGVTQDVSSDADATSKDAKKDAMLPDATPDAEPDVAPDVAPDPGVDTGPSDAVDTSDVCEDTTPSPIVGDPCGSELDGYCIGQDSVYIVCLNGQWSPPQYDFCWCSPEGTPCQPAYEICGVGYVGITRAGRARTAVRRLRMDLTAVSTAPSATR